MVYYDQGGAVTAGSSQKLARTISRSIFGEILVVHITLAPPLQGARIAALDQQLELKARVGPASPTHHLPRKATDDAHRSLSEFLSPHEAFYLQQSYLIHTDWAFVLTGDGIMGRMWDHGMEILKNTTNCLQLAWRSSLAALPAWSLRQAPTAAGIRRCAEAWAAGW